MSRKKNNKDKNSVTVANKEVIENVVNDEQKQGRKRIMDMLNGMMNVANNDVVNGGNNMNTQNNNQVAQAAQQVMQQATVAGQQGQAVPVYVNPNFAAQAQYAMPQQGQPVQFVDPNQIQQVMQQQAVAQQLTNPNPATQAQQVIAVPAQGQQQVQAQPAQGQQPKVVYVQVPVPAQAQTQEQAPQVVEVESESSFTDEHPILTLGLMAAGAYVGYKFISNVFFDDNNSSSVVSDNDTIDLVPTADFSSFF